MKKTKKLKLISNQKCYHLDQSPFYKLQSKKKLLALLCINEAELKDCITSPLNYNVFLNGTRVIETPIGVLKKVHWRIASLLIRVNVPEYLQSGKKKHSNISNAKVHIGDTNLLSTDIKSFYPSTLRYKVFNFFLNIMKCSVYVADILSKLSTYNDHIPTGSQLSMPLVFWSNFRMFSQLNGLAEKHNAKMTVYVDDITFSGNSVNNLFLSVVKKIIISNNHTPHPNKTKLYASKENKIVTGVVIKGSKILIMNKHHKAIYQDLTVINACKLSGGAPSCYEITKKRLLGRVNALKLIDTRLQHKIEYFSNL
ncbi:reverse transcriptase family protein [Thorsellia anophelis]|uniref:Reverse transcriptase (RNA-dependent DNA polymerase) n=1 Tax=Thorsellia anophelis DSM 18579 TaxID=1123402 RepID=A0A1I0D6L7_9GAMM|nr:reverse transcriptase family protein [Thorsellia anophelis]SET27820.1 hypothetical protein SAMN02583745_01869 [Thorsellia anophelis DSM 18579]